MKDISKNKTERHFREQNWKTFQLFEYTAVAYQQTQRTLLRRFGSNVTQHWAAWAKRWGWGNWFLYYSQIYTQMFFFFQLYIELNLKKKDNW